MERSNESGFVGMLAVLGLGVAIVGATITLGMMSGQSERKAYLDQSRRIARETNEGLTELMALLLETHRIYETTYWNGTKSDDTKVEWRFATPPGWTGAKHDYKGPYWSFSHGPPGAPGATISAAQCNPRELNATDIDTFFGPGKLPPFSACALPPEGMVSEMEIRATVNDPAAARYELSVVTGTRLAATPYYLEGGARKSDEQGMLLKSLVRAPPPPNFCYGMEVVNLLTGSSTTKVGPSDPLRISWTTSVGAGTITVEEQHPDGTVVKRATYTPELDGKGDGHLDVTAPAALEDVRYRIVTTPRPGAPPPPPGGFPWNSQCERFVDIVCPYLTRSTTHLISPFGSVPVGANPPAPWEFVDIGPGICPAGPGDTCILMLIPPCPGSACPGFWGVLANVNSPSCSFIGPTGTRNPSCFPPETRLRMADGSLRRVDGIAHGDLVYNPVTRAAMEVKGITQGAEKVPLHEIGYDDIRLRASETHPIHTPDGPRQIRDLRVGDRVLGEDYAFHELDYVGRPPLDPGQIVINFDFDSFHSYDPTEHWVAAEGIVAGDNAMQLRLHRQYGLPSFLTPVTWHRKGRR